MTHVCSSGSENGVVSIGHSVLSRLWLRLWLRLRSGLKLGLSLRRDLGALWLASDINACPSSSLTTDTPAAALISHDILLRASVSLIPSSVLVLSLARTCSSGRVLVAP